MIPWNERPIEIRNLFNPAFCGLVLARALAAFQAEDARGMPFSLTLPVLPLCLHRQSREILRDGSRSYFLKVVAEHPELHVGLARRCTEMLPFALEGLGLLRNVGTLVVSPDGRLLLGDGVRKTVSGTDETMACQRAASYLGREFARVGDRATIYTTLGVRP